MRNIFLFCCLACFVYAVRLIAEEPPAKLPTPTAKDFDQLSKIFAPPGIPSIQNKRWVIVDHGPSNWKRELRGWAIEDHPQWIIVMQFDGEQHNLRKPNANDKRPSIPELPGGGFNIGVALGAEYSVAWGIQTADYLKECEAFHQVGLPKETWNEGDEWNQIFRGINDRFNLLQHSVNAARHAHYAQQLGQQELAEKLYLLSQQGQQKYNSKYRGANKDALTVFVEDAVSSSLQNAAFRSAYGGETRSQLKKRWEQISALPNAETRKEALAMVQRYEQLIDEDSKWKEPDEKILAAYTTEQKVSYWLYHLRDLDTYQLSDPGSASAFGSRINSIDENQPTKLQPAEELKKLGLAAVPALISHLDDMRPTRCEGHWRSWWPEGRYLLSYADCCREIFEAITKQDISPEQRTMATKASEEDAKKSKAKAEAWWKEHLAKQKK